MIQNERGSTLGYFLAALLGALLGGMLVVTVLNKEQKQADVAPPLPIKSTHRCSFHGYQHRHEWCGALARRWSPRAWCALLGYSRVLP